MLVVEVDKLPWVCCYTVVVEMIEVNVVLMVVLVYEVEQREIGFVAIDFEEIVDEGIAIETEISMHMKIYLNLESCVLKKEIVAVC